MLQRARCSRAAPDPDPTWQDFGTLAMRVGVVAATIEHVRQQRLELGLNVADGRLHAAIEAMGPSEVKEVRPVLREIEWRLGELERALQIRSGQFGPMEAQRVKHLIEQAHPPMLLASAAAAAS